MRILDRFIIKEFLRSFVPTVISLVGIYAIIEFLEKIDEVVKRRLPTSVMLKYLFFSLPQIFFQLLPVAFLIALLLTLGLMSRNGELMAMKAGGISLYRTSAVLLAIALIFSLLALAGNEIVLPASNQLASYYKKTIEGKKPKKNLPLTRIWFWEGKNRLFNIQLVEAHHQEIQGITFFELNSQFCPIRRIDAQKGVYNQGQWYLYDGIERTFGYLSSSKIRFRAFQEEVFPIPEGFEDIFALQKQPEEMNYYELSNYIERLQEAGYPVNKYLVDLHTRLSLPFLTLIMALLGISFAVKLDKSVRLFNIGLGLLISFIYWIIFYLGLSFGQIGFIPSVLSAWLGNIIFLGLGTWLFITMPT